MLDVLALSRDTLGDWAISLGPRVFEVVLFGAIGVALMLGGFKVFDLMLPKLDFQTELGDKRNTPLASVLAVFFLAIAIIVYSAMH